jgi:hypothetical protein
MFIFDGDAKRIYIAGATPAGGTIEFTPAELWTAYVDWVSVGDNSKYLPALDSVMVSIGVNQYVGPYIFIRNDLGWMGVPPAVDPITIVINGSFYAKDPLQSVMANQPGQETDLVINRAAITSTVTVGGGTDLTTVLSRLTAMEAKMASKGDVYAAAFM